MPHHCHALYCSTNCRPEYLMCPRHWRAVPKHLQREVLRYYRDGQCEDMNFTKEWHVAATNAINAVALLERHITPEQAARRLETVIKLYDEET